jgi:uncharacterized membrane protein
MKKYLLFSALAMGVIFIASFASLSFAQSSANLPEFFSERDTFVFVQTLLENSDGQVVTYLTSDKFTDLNKAALQILLDKEVSDKDPIIEINGEKFQVIKRKLTITYDKENVIASTILADSTEGVLTTVARFAHDGYPIVEGDKVHSIWTFLRPVE